MNQEVAFECGMIETVAFLKKNDYISPADTLGRTKFNIQENEREAFTEGCIQAVIKFKLK